MFEEWAKQLRTRRGAETDSNYYTVLIEVSIDTSISLFTDTMDVAWRQLIM